MPFKQTQNQYFGKASGLPSKLPTGSEYIVTDSGGPKLYIYGADEKPFLINTAAPEDEVTDIENQIIVTQANHASTLGGVIGSCQLFYKSKLND